MSSTTGIVAFQKNQILLLQGISTEILNITGRSAEVAANKYYALSSLVSYMTLQSRYIVPPDISMYLHGPASGHLTNRAAQYIGPSGPTDFVYEFPKTSSFPTTPVPNKTYFISWDASYSPIRATPHDPGILWGNSGDMTQYDDPDNPESSLYPPVTFPKVIKSKFKPLEDTHEFRDLSTRIGKIEKFLSNFSINGPIINPQANFYLGLSGNLSGVQKDSDNWNDISNAGLWRQLV